MFSQIQSVKLFLTTTMAMASLIMASGCAVSVGAVNAVLMKEVLEAKLEAEPTVKLVRRGHDAVFFSDEATLSPMERKRLDVFLEKFSADLLDNVFVIVGGDGADHELAANRAAGVTTYLESRGRFVSAPPPDLATDLLSDDSVKVVLQSLETYPSKIPDWFAGPGRNFAVVDAPNPNQADKQEAMVSNQPLN